jgi:hypothetical protein
MGLPSPANQVLEMPELLNSIFDLLDKHSNANNARVCKQWSEIVFACLWREVDDLHHLFKKLSPLYCHWDLEYVSFYATQLHGSPNSSIFI